MATLDRLRKRKTEILDAAARHGAHNLRVFGSVARLTDTEASDIDLLVDFDADRSLLDLVGLKLDLESLLGRQADVLTEAALSVHLRERVLAEAKPL